MYTDILHQEQKEVDAVQDRITEHIQIISKKKTMVDSNLILTCLKNHFIFYNLSEMELENIKDKMFYCSIVEGEFVFKEGEKGHCFFVVERGILELIVDGKLKKEIKNFDGTTTLIKALESLPCSIIPKGRFLFGLVRRRRSG